MEMGRIPSSTQKALEINLNNRIYGTFAEIGAGQEVARHFFRAGGAAGTIAKSMSAYDMTVSDAIYGKSSRYVSEDRLETMLKRELDQLRERLDKNRGPDTAFFVYADTVATRSFKTRSDGHGWIGVRFQDHPQAEVSQIIIHLNMLDKENLQQQEAVGIVGVNLIYGCYHYCEDREKFVRGLLDNLAEDRVEIDLIALEGPAFKKVDDRLWNLELVKNGHGQAVMFNEKGNVLLAKDALYRKNVAVCRGSYRPPTLVNLDMLEKGKDAFCASLEEQERKDVLVLPEISMNKLRDRGDVDSEDFLARVDLITSLGHHVLLSSYESYDDLGFYLQTCTKKYIGFIMGHYNLQEIFNEERYKDRPEGILGGLGRLLGHRCKIFAYPALDEKTKRILKAGDAEMDFRLKLLFEYMVERGHLTDIVEFNKDTFHIWSRVVLRMIQNGESGWEKMVPDSVSQTVKKDCLFGYPCEVKSS